jgi:hypothetical protein
MTTLTCPKCSKVFKDKYESLCKVSLSRHLNRKNPCDRNDDTVYIREKTVVVKPTAPDLSQLNIDIEKAPLVDMIVRVFQLNECACMPNISKQHVVYRLDGKVRSEPLTDFIKTFWFRVMIPQFFKKIELKVTMFGVDAASETLSPLEYELYVVGHKTPEGKPGFYPKLLKSLRGYFNTMEKSKRLEIKGRMDGVLQTWTQA